MVQVFLYPRPTVQCLIKVGEKAAGDHFGAEAIMNNHARDADMVVGEFVQVSKLFKPGSGIHESLD